MDFLNSLWPAQTARAMAFCCTMRDSHVGLAGDSWKTENSLCNSDESYLRSRNQGDLSKTDKLSVTIPPNGIAVLSLQ